MLMVVGPVLEINVDDVKSHVLYASTLVNKLRLCAFVVKLNMSVPSNGNVITDGTTVLKPQTIFTSCGTIVCEDDTLITLLLLLLLLLTVEIVPVLLLDEIDNELEEFDGGKTCNPNKTPKTTPITTTIPIINGMTIFIHNGNFDTCGNGRGLDLRDVI